MHADEVLSAAHDRSRARAAKDWAEADRLRDVIETAGWKVVDRGTDFALSPLAPPDVEADGDVRYGSSANVPSRFDEPATGLATVVLIATDHSCYDWDAVVGQSALVVDTRNATHKVGSGRQKIVRA